MTAPKGSLVLWDSRTVHFNCYPKKNRSNEERFRYTLYVCMTPREMAREKDLRDKVELFENLSASNHVPHEANEMGSYEYGSVKF